MMERTARLFEAAGCGGIGGGHDFGDHTFVPFLSAEVCFDFGAGYAFGELTFDEFKKLRALREPSAWDALPERTSQMRAWSGL